MGKPIADLKSRVAASPELGLFWASTPKPRAPLDLRIPAGPGEDRLLRAQVPLRSSSGREKWRKNILEIDLKGQILAVQNRQLGLSAELRP